MSLPNPHLLHLQARLHQQELLRESELRRILKKPSGRPAHWYLPIPAMRRPLPTLMAMLHLL